MPSEGPDAVRLLEPSGHYQAIPPRSAPHHSIAAQRTPGSSYNYIPAADPSSYRAYPPPGSTDSHSGYSHLSPLYPDHTRNYQVQELGPAGAPNVSQWPQPYPVQYAQHSPYQAFEDSRTGSYESVVGKPGYPAPASARGPKQRFTDEDDELLRRLKEGYVNPRLSWKQIADFFPDRNSGTLQVRYCTKLKKKDEIRWTEESDRKLIKLLKDDEEGRWKRVAQKLGNGATDQACEARADELNARSLQAQGYSDGD